MTATPQIPIITYAASIANSGYDQLNSLPYVRTAIDSYRAVSVRDMYTYDYVQKYTEKDPIMVCDPTLLHDKTHYISKCKNWMKRNICFYICLITQMNALLIR